MVKAQLCVWLAPVASPLHAEIVAKPRAGQRRGLVVGHVKDEVPDALGIGDRRAEHHAAVADLDRAVDLGDAGQRDDLDVGDVVAGDAAVDRLQADGRVDRRRGVDDDVGGGRGRAGVAGRIGRRRREAVVAVGQAPR